MRTSRAALSANNYKTLASILTTLVHAKPHDSSRYSKISFFSVARMIGTSTDLRYS